MRAWGSRFPRITLRDIDSPYGHDGFLVEVDRVAGLVRELLADAD